MNSSPRSGTIVSSILGASQVAELLGRLRTTVRDFAGKEEALHAAARLKSSDAAKAFELAGQQQATRLAESLAAAQADLEAARHKAVARFEAREARIHQAHKSSRKRMLDAIEQREGRQK